MKLMLKFPNAYNNAINPTKNASAFLVAGSSFKRFGGLSLSVSCLRRKGTIYMTVQFFFISFAIKIFPILITG